MKHLEKLARYACIIFLFVLLCISVFVYGVCTEVGYAKRDIILYVLLGTCVYVCMCIGLYEYLCMKMYVHYACI